MSALGSARATQRRSAPRQFPVWIEPITVADRMRSPVVTVGVAARARDAARTMRARKVRHLPVVDADGHLVGIVTDRDLRQIVFDPHIHERLGCAGVLLDALPVRDVMTWGVITVRPDTDIREAARLMHEQKIGALPVVEGGKVVGMVTENDVLAVIRLALRTKLRRVRPLAAAASGDYDYGFPVPARGDAWRDNGGEN